MDIASIPAKDAIILWQEETRPDPGHLETYSDRVVEVLVCHRREQPSWSRRLVCSRGACDFDWLSGGWHTTPMGGFLHMLNKPGFMNDNVKITALREFTKISGQHWAIALLRDLGERVAAEWEASRVS